MRRVLTLMAVLFVAVVSAAAHAAPTVTSVLQKMKDAFEPDRPSVRTLTITVNDMGETQKLVAGQARKRMADGKRMTTVVLEPAEARGIGFLVFEPTDHAKPTLMWMYVPVIRRVREVLPIDSFEHFLGTDFTYADLGFVRMHKTYRLVGVKQHNGTNAYQVEEKLPPALMYYSRVVAWIAQSSMLPLERDYYDPTGMLWKKELFDSATMVDGTPTILHVQMKDLEGNTSSDLNVTQIKYDVNVPDALLEPQSLPKLADDPLWKASVPATP